MFYDFYSLSGLPFEERLAPDKLLADERFAKGIERLDYFAHAGLAAILTGPTGVGKSSLLRLFLARLPVNRYQTLLVQQTPMEASSLLRLLVRTLNEKPGFGRDRLFAQILNKAQAADRSTLLLIDEAHLLREAALTDLRLLLCGQDGLLQTLARQSLADLLNRVTVRVHLAPLTKDQTVCYLDHRLKTVGGSDKLFGDDAKARLHDYASGIPRLLNNLATLCLIQGAAKKQKLINVPLVDEAARELRML